MATYTLISSVTVGSGGAASIEFTSIPATYTDLCLVYSLRGNIAGSNDECNILINGATSSYTNRYLQGNGTSASSGSSYTTKIYTGETDGSTATANTFGNGSAYFPNYAGSNYKSLSTDGVSENNAASAYTNLSANLWSNTAAITSISLQAYSGTWLQYSTAYLYGISNA